MYMMHNQSNANPKNVSIFQLISDPRIESIKTLLNSADKDKVLNSVDELYKCSPLSLAIRLGHVDIVKLLLSCQADVSVGGLRMRKSVLDDAQNSTEMTQLILPVVKMFVDTKKSSAKSSKETEKAKLALLAISLADYYYHISNIELADEYLAVFQDLTLQIQTSSSTLSKSAQYSIQGPLAWRFFQHEFNRKNFDSAYQAFVTSQKNYIAATQLEVSNVLFENEMIFDCLYLMARADKIEKNDKIVTSFCNLVYLDKIKNLNPFLTGKLNSIVKEHPEFENNGILSITEFLLKMGTILKKKKGFSGIEGIFAVINQIHLWYDALPNKIETKKFTVINNIANQLIKELEITKSFKTKMNSDEVKNWIQTKNYRQFFAFLRREFVPIQKMINDNSDFPDISELCKGYISSKDNYDTLYIDEVKFDSRFPADKFRNYIETVDMVFDFAMLTKDKNNLGGACSLLVHVIMQINRDTVITSIEYNEFKSGILKLMKKYIECEFLLMDALKESGEENLWCFSTLILLERTRKNLIYPKKKFDQFPTEHMPFLVALSHLYSRAYLLIKEKQPQTEFDTDFLTVFSTLLISQGEYELSVKIAFELFEQSFKEEFSDKLLTNLTAAVTLLANRGVLFVQRYDIESLKKLDHYMALTIKIPAFFKKIAIAATIRENIFFHIINLWQKQIKHLEDHGYYGYVHKYTLALVNSLLPILEENTQQIAESNRTLNRIIPAILLQMQTENKLDEVAVRDLLKTFELWLDGNQLNDVSNMLETIYAHQSKLASFKGEVIILQGLVERFENHSCRSKEKYIPLLLKLKLNYLNACVSNQQNVDITDKNVDSIAAVFKTCYRLTHGHRSSSVQLRKKIKMDIDQILSRSAFQLAEYYSAKNQPEDALDHYNIVIEINLPVQNSSDLKSLAKQSLIKTNQILSTMINDNLSPHSTIGAIILCDQIIANSILLEDDVQKMQILSQQFKFVITQLDEFMSENKFSNVIALAQQTIEKLLKMHLAKEDEFILPLQDKIILAKTAIKNECQEWVKKSDQLIKQNSIADMIKDCDKKLKKLILVGDDQEAKSLTSEISKRKSTIERELYLDKTYGQSQSQISKIKTKTTVASPSTSPIEKSNVELKSTLPTTATATKLPCYPNGKVGQRIESQFLQQGTSKIFPVLMKEIRGFKELKITNFLLYKQIKAGALAGRLCRKFGQCGIKNLKQNGFFEVKVPRKKPRLIGHLEEGCSDTNFNLWVMPNLPKDLTQAKFKNAYIFLSSHETLYFIRHDEARLVNIDHQEKFNLALQKLLGNDNKINISKDEVYQLITENGGHSPDVTYLVWDSYSDKGLHK